ncbi:ABC transporter permease [Streptomyces sp. NBC_01218]|uniref:ABC transporter permease subunit n=1 Tax=unclassified Streptomyces TaxID=2593676 RepID=UPI0023B9E596|nr:MULTISPECIES: ABC transporter permease subunit [unclassified Streptomyces]WEH39643.1 ABC transporter permease subunit [Streptomyces sp. AM 2-1-1]WSQ51334.1 ABC transporter permease [Streptomyces sp. NBC_01218]
MTTPATPPLPQAHPQERPGPAVHGPLAPGMVPGLSNYVSPIAVRPATFGDALASEWTKIRSVRSTMWTLGTMVALLLGIGVLVAFGVDAASDAPGGEAGNDVLSLGFFGVLLGSVCVITLGVLTIASEFGTGMIRTTLTACPSRSRVLMAKAVVFFLLVFVLTTVTTAVVAMLQTAVLGGGASASGADWIRATVGIGLYTALLGLLSLAVGTIVRHSAGAITIMIGVVLLPLVLALFMAVNQLTRLRELLFEYSVPSQIAALYESSITESGPSGWEPVAIMFLLTAVVLVVANLALNRRDV